MVFWRSVIAALWGSAVFTPKVLAADDGPVSVASKAIVPGAYIVEFADEADGNGFMQALVSDARVGNVSRRMSLESSIFKGLSFHMDGTLSTPEYDQAAIRIRALSQVKNLWPVILVPPPKVNISWTASEMDAPKLRRRQSDDSNMPHIMTQVDKMHEAGYRGQGLRLGIVDTGVDYTHPALGGCFGPGCLVEYGTDLVGDDYDGLNTPVPDSDPYDGCEGHGTHVTGIIAAMENPYGFVGAAPDVKVGMYKVFGCNGDSGSDMMIAGLLQAYEDGSDLISGSIGYMSGWSEDIFSVVASRIVAAGVPVVFATGNSGGASNGLFSVAAPASGPGVLAVASFDNEVIPEYDEVEGVTYTPNTNSGGQASWFTSWGPTFEIELKPQFGAVGGWVLSTLPLTMGGYGVLSGTSMATPLTASIVALLMQARNISDASLIERLLSSTAKRGEDGAFGTGFDFSPVPKQGAGLVQVYDAAHATTLLDKPSLSFNDSDHHVSESTFTITNIGDSDTTYSVSHIPALTADTLYLIYRSSEPDLHQEFAELTFEPSSLTLAPNASAEIRVRVVPPSNVDPIVLPVYSGWIALNATNNNDDSLISLPYVGVAGSMRNATVFASDRVYLSRSDDDLMLPAISEGTTFQIYAPDAHPEWAKQAWNVTDTVLPPGTMPYMWMWLVLGSAEVRMEPVLIKPACDGPKPVPSDNGLGVETLGSVFGYPMLYHEPIGWTSRWRGRMAGDTWAPAGRYRLSIFSLKILGDRSVPEGWDRKDTVEFNIRYVKQE